MDKDLYIEQLKQVISEQNKALYACIKQMKAVSPLLVKALGETNTTYTQFAATLMNGRHFLNTTFKRTIPNGN